jgi:hypothetical protein
MLDGGHAGGMVNIGSVNSFLGFPTGAARLCHLKARSDELCFRGIGAAGNQSKPCVSRIH